MQFPEKILKESATAKTSRVVFDIATLRKRSVLKAVDDSGRRMTLRCNEGFYMPSELYWMLETLGFRNIGIFGCMPGRFSRKAKPSPEDFELLATALK